MPKIGIPYAIVDSLLKEYYLSSIAYFYYNVNK